MSPCVVAAPGTAESSPGALEKNLSNYAGGGRDGEDEPMRTLCNLESLKAFTPEGRLRFQRVSSVYSVQLGC